MVPTAVAGGVHSVLVGPAIPGVVPTGKARLEFAPRTIRGPLQEIERESDG
jgi:hypothetical protein